jgi:hypothetical protein
MAERTRPNSRRGAGTLTMYQHVISTDALLWLPLEFPGVFMRVVHKDARTGGMTVMTRLEPGASITAHFHAQADETVYVLSGDSARLSENTPHYFGLLLTCPTTCAVTRGLADRCTFENFRMCR